ncbi:class I SAM-dependent methyltransferase [Aeromicrobium sp. IC_218]|uniref:methyltransferase n=1 Tax=Aeromicrobium sp. IC_218 TaxID=2545468 RepID=UPI00103CFCC3|nr:class I SAM-dependent methyltransferase [Aeromicrobium sp. IC_218]TCI97563.1 class I SAM-dependent methyltransferase [Aeromicrobium sp. IC_218]
MQTTEPRTTSFGPLDIDFDDRVLEPREWTQAQSQWAADLLDEVPEGPVLELCAGAGHIGLLAVAASDRRLVMVDVNPVAVAYATANAERNGLADRVEVREGDMREVVAADERFALVVADPPWVRSSDLRRFPADPQLAIDGGDDGLDLARLCLDVIGGHLLPGGVAILQLGPEQHVPIAAELAEGRWPGLVPGGVREHGERGCLLEVRRPA